MRRHRNLPAFFRRALEMGKIYQYQAKAVKVYDGDTCTVDIDLGLKVWLFGEKIRLARIDAPELRGKTRDAGIKARDYLQGLIEGKAIVIETIKDRQEKYGRYMADVWIDDVNVNDLMVESGNAIYREF